MVTDVFSVFDEHYFSKSGFSYYLWVSCVALPVLLLFCDLWLKKGVITLFRNKLLSSSFMLMKLSSSCFKLSGFPLGMGSLLVLLFTVNTFSLFPYVFKVSAHFSFGSSFSLSMWSAIVISSVFWSFEQVLALLVPYDCPLIMGPFMVLIEFISHLLRPMSLFIRLAMNLATGKVMMLMAASSGFKLLLGLGSVADFFVTIMVLVSNGMMFCFEAGSSVAQAFIFCFLLSLYASEHSD
uniref:ATP synthase subunit a n=1 Tax=Arcuatula senhousia TaxID=1954227 RepID=E2DHW6_ARCSE|nr:ATP synthase F0 subunit 6 [Arcuatula senhousia]ACY00227.1 ATP synthase F0 subunit 6 [Arcuatula senhousia]